MDDNLFEKKPSTLAERLRPNSLDEMVGQSHLISEGKTLRRLLQKDKISSLIFYGPPGTGKTTLAKIISKVSQADFNEINATGSSVKIVRDICEKASEQRRYYQKRTILFIDEVHRFNKAQQDVLLPFVERGDIIFIGATTFNPFFYITPALNSRSLLFEFQPLDEKDLCKIIDKAIHFMNIDLQDSAKDFLIKTSNQDARVLLNRLELLDNLYDNEKIDVDKLKEIFPNHAFSYERADDHYDVISAFIKSVRGSDANAALYWLAVMIEGGEDPRFIARRLAILAAEDIGLAEPGALAIIAGGFDMVEKIGMPEARIILSEMTLYLASLPKSNSACIAIDKALAYVKNNVFQGVPAHLKDAHYQGAKKLKRGINYLYPHNYPYHYIDQTYTKEPVSFYEPGDLGREKRFKEYFNFLKTLKNQEEES